MSPPGSGHPPTAADLPAGIIEEAPPALPVPGSEEPAAAEAAAEEEAVYLARVAAAAGIALDEQAAVAAAVAARGRSPQSQSQAPRPLADATCHRVSEGGLLGAPRLAAPNAFGSLCVVRVAGV